MSRSTSARHSSTSRAAGPRAARRYLSPSAPPSPTPLVAELLVDRVDADLVGVERAAHGVDRLRRERAALVDVAERGPLGVELHPAEPLELGDAVVAVAEVRVRPDLQPPQP